MERRRSVTFEDWAAKAAWLDGAAQDDARRPYTREVARWIACSFDPNDREGIARAIFELVKTQVRYVPDPDSEDFSDSDLVLRDCYGDCDDKARCFVALARSLRFEAAIRPVLSRRPDGRDDFTHVQAVIRWPRSAMLPCAGQAGWIVAELILRDAQLGDDVQHVGSKTLA